MSLKALIFDCDGVLADTERDGHRVSFNLAFEQKGLPDNWSIELYKKLLKTSGGKERIKNYFDMKGWPDGISNRNQFIQDLHERKTILFMDLIKKGQIPVRSGINRLIDEAISAGLKLAICSTSNEKSVNLIAKSLLGIKRIKYFSCILAGDIVAKKKPDPEIYQLVLLKLKLKPEECLVIEDNRNGLLAAKGAGLRCLITTNDFSKDENLEEADLIVHELGDSNNIHITLNDLKKCFT
jgi:HAD superfamily hydrolase (TIGR01509 family)